MPDYSASFFLSEGSDTPSFPPARFHLPNGQSRYSGSCVLEDLKAIGLQGPLEIPDKQPNEVIEWSSELNRFVASPVDEKEKEALATDELVRTHLKFVLNTKQDFLTNLDSFFEDYAKEKSLYFCKIEAALSSSELLTFEDIPADVTCVSCEGDLKLLWEDYKEINLSSWQQDYETYGIVLNVDEQFRPYFELDSSWVKGSEPLPDALTPPFAFDYRDV